MKVLRNFYIVATVFLFSGCIVPAKIYFRNKSSFTVRLKGKIAEKEDFNRLPNKVDFYTLPQKEKGDYGVWKQTTFLTWVDTANFFIDIPPNTVVDIEDVSDSYSLGLPFPRVVLIVTTENNTDILSNGSAEFLYSKFVETRKFLSGFTYYYDVK